MKAGLQFIFRSMMILAIAASAAPGLAAQETDAPEDTSQTLTLEQVQASRDQIAGRTDLEEKKKDEILGHYDEAIEQLRAMLERAQRAEQFDKLREEAPEATEEFRQKLGEPAGEVQVEIAENATLEEIKTRVQEAESEYSTIKAEYDQLMQEPTRRASRRNEVPALIADARKRQQEIQQQLTDAVPSGDAPELGTARRTALEARSKALLQEISALEKELLSYEARNSLLTLRQEDAKRRLARAEKRLDALQDAAEKRRRTEAEKAEREARQALRELELSDPEIKEAARELAERNEELAQLRTGPEGLTRKIDKINRQIDETAGRLKQLEDEYTRILQRVKAGGLNSAVGAMLRKQKSILPDVRRVLREIDGRREVISDVQLAQNELREERLDLADLEERVLAEVETLQQNKEKAQKLINELLQNQRNLIGSLQQDYESYLDNLFDLSTRQQQLVNQTQRVEDYIDENILWIGGTTPLGRETLTNTLYALRWLIEPSEWRKVPGLLLTNLFRNLLSIALLALLAAGGLYARQRCLRRIRECGETAHKAWTTDFRLSIEALALTVIAAATGPCILWAIGWRLAAGAGVIDQARCLGNGIQAAALVWFCTQVIRQLLAKGGLAVRHFGWPERHTQPARRLLGLLAAGAIPFLLLVITFEGQPEESFKDSAGRLAFTAAMIVFVIVLHRLFRLVYRALSEQRPGSWFIGKPPLRWLCHVLVTGLPVVLGLMALGGYYFTALHLGYRFFWTLLLICTVLMLVSLARRWLLLTRRKLAMDQARRRREAMRSEEGGDEKTEEELMQEELDLVRIDTQSQQLINNLAFILLLAAAWFIWLDVIPALNYFDNIRLWGSMAAVEEEIAAEDGTTEIVVRQTMKWVTVSNLGLALIILFLTWISMKNLPAMVEILLLQRLGMGGGERYAMLAVVRYIIVGAGVILAFNAIGMDWSSIQWLVAALGVGLGFGLQEIFANFISGLILLFERPVRVGDTVTVGDISGKVTKIRMRATTITDWDCKELIVPNKEFITGQLVNWSLSDNLIRVVVPVGIAYGSNTEKALEILKRLASQHPDVLSEPQPQVFFLGFGGSSLDFEVRAYAPGMDYYLRIKHDLHFQIDQEFRKADIEISFPQRDLHVRSGLEGLTDAIRGLNRDEAGPA
jgi:potassium-dependent mechanosensitive channel